MITVYLIGGPCDLTKKVYPKRPPGETLKMLTHSVPPDIHKAPGRYPVPPEVGALEHTYILTHRTPTGELIYCYSKNGWDF